MSVDAKPNYPIGSVDRALRLFSVFRDQPTASLSDIADHLGVSRSTAHRLLAMFVYHGYARQDPQTKKYVGGPQLLELSLGALRHTSIVTRARPLMLRVSAELQETVHLILLNGGEITFVDGVECDRALRAGLRVGMSLPAHATAAGKALLAELPEERLDALYPDDLLPSVTSKTLRTRADLDRELRQARRRGYAINDEETERGLRAVGTAFPTLIGHVQAGLAVAAPTVRLDRKAAARLGETLVREVRGFAAEIEADQAQEPVPPLS